MNTSEERPEEKALIFIHIPKAAGTTLHQILERQYSSRKTFTIDGAHVRESIEEFKNLPERKRANIRCLKGHMPFGLHKYLPVPAQYITVLRDPIDRIISHYYFVLQTPNHYLYRELVSKNLSLEEYVKSGLTPELDNSQVRLICGIPSVDMVSGQGPLTREALETAKENMDRYFVGVGISEKFDESVLMFKNLLGWKNGYYAKENVTRKRSPKPEVPKAVIKAIEASNELDMELYEFGRQKYLNLFHKYGPDINQLRDFQKKNHYFGLAYNMFLIGLPKKVIRRVVKIFKENTVWRKSILKN